jgi:PAS domain S-box-containing protein
LSIGLKIKSNIAFSLALIALACMGWFSLREGRQLTEEARWVSHTYEVLETSASLRSHLADSEAARSAFILGDTKQLRVFERARDLALTDFADMRQLTADNREQQNRLRNLEPLLYSKLHTLQKSIDVHWTIKDDEAAQRAVADQGTRLTAQFASLLQVFDGVERGLLRERSAVAGKGSHRTTRATAALSGSSFLFLILALAALNRELSSRAQAEHAIVEQRTLLQSILSSCKDAVVVADRSARVIFRNPAALRLHGGIPIDELMDGTTQMLGYHKSDGITLLPAEDLPIFRTLQGESVDGVELCVRRPGSGDAQWLLAAGGPLRNEDGESQGGVVFLRDITDLKRGEEALKRSNRELEETSAKLLSQSERLSLATTVAKVGVWEWDPASNLVTCDNTMYEIYGFTPVV